MGRCPNIFATWLEEEHLLYCKSEVLLFFVHQELGWGRGESVPFGSYSPPHQPLPLKCSTSTDVACDFYWIKSWLWERMLKTRAMSGFATLSFVSIKMELPTKELAEKGLCATYPPGANPIMSLWNVSDPPHYCWRQMWVFVTFPEIKKPGQICILYLCCNQADCKSFR